MMFRSPYDVFKDLETNNDYQWENDQKPFVFQTK